jgi:predicted amidophosphoribosyltransferase
VSSGVAPEPNPRRAARPIAVEAGEHCHFCNGELPAGRSISFCPHCGQDLTVVHCPACGSELERGWKFCVTCGRSSGDD